MTESASTPTVVVPAWARLELSRAAVQVLADEVGCRMLHIKGAAVDPTIRPTARHGSDVDVIADPGSIRRLHPHLLAHGWRVYSTFRFGSAFEHAQTYLHDGWGYLDLHRRFPGIGLGDQQAFELLWADRTERESAGIPFSAPGVDAQLAILVLNSARGGVGLPAAWDELDDAGRGRVRRLVERLHADVAFAAAAGDLERYRDHREYRLWKAVSDGGPRIAEWWGRVLAQPTIRGRARIAAQSVLVNTDRLEHRLGHPPTRWQIVAEFFARGGRAIAEAGRMLARRVRGRR